MESGLRGAGPSACHGSRRIELCNLSSGDWTLAPLEMLLISRLSENVRKPYYHLVLTWHAHEQPTDDHQIAAMHHLIRTLGLDEHQIVIGIHRDTARCHIHAVANTVHPLTGKVWSKSRGREKAELACRQIEIECWN